jgi:hypothetical protein
MASIQLTPVCETRLSVELEGLQKVQNFIGEWITTTPTKYMRGYQIQNTTGTAEILNIGDVTTPYLVAIHAVDNEVDIDCNFVTTFKASITIKEGQYAVFAPSGIVYIKEHTTSEVVTLDYFVCGI